jgi:hypothetical protein
VRGIDGKRELSQMSWGGCTALVVEAAERATSGDL